MSDNVKDLDIQRVIKLAKRIIETANPPGQNISKDRITIAVSALAMAYCGGCKAAGITQEAALQGVVNMWKAV